MHRYSFPAGSAASLVLGLEFRDHLEQGSIVIVSPAEELGDRRSSSRAKDQRMFFCMRFRKPMLQMEQEQLADQIEQWQKTKDAFVLGDLLGEPLIVKGGADFNFLGTKCSCEAARDQREG